MSPKPDDESPLDESTLRALRAAGDLLPTSEAEVEQAEATLPEVGLPASLQRYRSAEKPGSNVAPLAVKSRFPAYAMAAAAGALAAWRAAWTMTARAASAPPAFAVHRLVVTACATVRKPTWTAAVPAHPVTPGSCASGTAIA